MIHLKELDQTETACGNPPACGEGFTHHPENVTCPECRLKFSVTQTVKARIEVLKKEANASGPWYQRFFG